MLGTVNVNAVIASNSATITLSEAGRAAYFRLNSPLRVVVGTTPHYATITAINTTTNQLTISLANAATGTINAGTLVEDDLYYNVTLYGMAEGNSAAANNTALGLTVNSAASVGIVYIPDGEYELAMYSISTNGTHIKLSNNATLKVPNGATMPRLLVVAADNVTIEGGIFDGNSSNVTSGDPNDNAIVLGHGVENLTIRGGQFGNLRRGAIGCSGANGGSNWLIEQCTITTSIGHAIGLNGGPSSNTVGTRNVKILNNNIQDSQTGNGIWVGNNYGDVRIDGNRITNVGRMGIEVYNNFAGSYTGENFVITNNIIVECGAQGISIDHSPHTTCANNIVDHAYWLGIEVAGSSYVVVDGNQISDLKLNSGGTSVGIAVNVNTGDNASDIAISGGLISGCVSGIDLCGNKGARRNITISGVVIQGCTYGIYALGNNASVYNVEITGCTIECALTGIGDVPGYSHLVNGTISDNTIVCTNQTTGVIGIRLFLARGLTITGNRVLCQGPFVGGHGIVIGPDHGADTNLEVSYDTKISNNIVTNWQSGIYVSYGSKIAINDNQVTNNLQFGIRLNAQNSYISLDGNMVVNDGEPLTCGIIVLALSESVSNISINGGVVSNCVSAINLWAGGGTIRHHITVSGVVILNSTYGIRSDVQTGATVRNATISGCDIQVSSVGIGDYTNGSRLFDSTITGNVIAVTGQQAGDVGIYLRVPRGNVITGNRILCVGSEKLGTGIYMNSSNSVSSDTLLNGNVLTNWSTGINVVNGINVLIATNHVRTPSNTVAITATGTNVVQANNMTV